MRNYNKTKQNKEFYENLIDILEFIKTNFLIRKKAVLISIISILILTTFSILQKGVSEITLSPKSVVQIKGIQSALTTEKVAVINIPSGMIKANPFLPYRDISERASITDIPEFDLVEPPETINENSDAARVMDTIVSGILYDKYSPSAILNIEGNDYLVKKGDVVNNYKVLNITKDSVTVKLGSNVYKAGIGEILTEGTLNHNDVSNLNNKFGGMQ